MAKKLLNKYLFNELIKEERKFMKVSQEVFGKILGVDEKTISAYERNQISPSPEIIVALMKYFGYRIKIIDRFDEETIFE